MKTNVLKPGILVSLKTSLRGGVVYERRDLPTGEAASAAEAAGIARWETTRIIDDPEEHEKAVKTRGVCARTIRSLCVSTAFGLLCAESAEAKLDAAIEEARRIANEHNQVSKSNSITVHVLKGRIASSDEEAARAIASEVTDLLSQMEEGIRRVDVKAVRDAANRARQIGAVLDESQAKVVSAAVEQARSAAREIVKRVSKGGEDAVEVIKSLSVSAIETARFAFLDLEASAPVEGEAIPAVDARHLDLEVTAEPVTTAPAPVFLAEGIIQADDVAGSVDAIAKAAAARAMERRREKREEEYEGMVDAEAARRAER